MSSNKAHQAGSGTLKLSKRTVMLYRSRYDREAKATRQNYVAGFSRSATEVPPAFMHALKQVVRQPERRQAMLSRIEIEVLVPARQSAVRAARRQVRLTALAPIAEARRALGRAARCLETVEAGEELSQELEGLSEAYQNFERLQSLGASKVLDVDGAIAALSAACTALSNAVNGLPRGTTIQPETINAWQRSWYLHQDMLATATRRAALKRPAGWSRPSVRRQVEQGLAASEKSLPAPCTSRSQDSA